MAPNSPLHCRAAKTPEELDKSVTFHYLAEGAANVVYDIRKYDKLAPNGEPFIFKGMKSVYDPRSLVKQVLRISKGLEKTQPAADIVYHFDKDIKPLFSKYQQGHTSLADNLTDLSLVALDASVFEALNAEIAKHSHRHTDRITPGTHGLLMEDMSSEPGRSITIEFKPKWLTQSPHAPSFATRCRTCAMEAVKAAKGKSAPSFYICPLRIVSGDISVITPFIEQKVRAAFAKLPLTPPPTAQQIAYVVSSIVEWLVNGQGHSLLATMKEIQLQYDEHDVAAPSSTLDPDSRMLPIAMTLRDCSLFIRVVYNHAGVLEPQRPLIEAKLGDLDFKSSAKMRDWEAKERKLRDGDWYTDRAGVVPWSFGNCGIVGDVKDGDEAGWANRRKATELRMKGLQTGRDANVASDMFKRVDGGGAADLRG